MIFLYIIIIVFLTFSCSENIEKNKVQKNNALHIENKSVDSLNTRSESFSNAHISGSNEPRVSGAPSSSHISGH